MFYSPVFLILLLLVNVTFSRADRDLSIEDPLLIVTADFNDDGNLDLAFSGKTTSQVFVMLGAGDGTFGAEVSFSTLGPPASLVTGEFNNDGNTDLAVAVPSRKSVVILFGNGAGGFSAPKELPTGNEFDSPLGVTAGDFDRDGNQDLMTITLGSNVISFVKGNGDGTFGPYTFAGTVRDDPLMIIQADFNRDGILDIATSNLDPFGVTVALGTGTGTLQFDFEIRTSSSGSLALTAGDFNNDELPDLAFLHRVPSLPGTFSLIASNGDGTFGPAGTTGFTGIDPRAIVAEDFNLDGNLDLAIANFQSNTVSIVQGTGDISQLGPVQDFSSFNNPIALATGDFNNDCRPDLAVLNAGSGMLSILLNTTTSTTPTTPLEIVDVSLSRDVLWPPNHKLLDVTVDYGTTNTCGAPTCSLSVTSNEPTNGTGNGDTAPDWEIVDEHHVRLRAERAGSGSGRVYTITITCTGSGGSTTKTVTVAVPKDQSRKQ